MFVRDQTSGALLNTDRKALEDYKAKLNIGTRVQNLEDDISDIKNMLLTLINKDK
jgi:hypothetical protein